METKRPKSSYTAKERKIPIYWMGCFQRMKDAEGWSPQKKTNNNLFTYTEEQYNYLKCISIFIISNLYIETTELLKKI